MYRNKCPRCNSETIELDTLAMDTQKKKQMRVSLRKCPKCLLLIYETTQ